MLNKIRSFCGSLPCALIFFIAACLVVLFGIEVAGALIFAMALSLLLILCDDVTVTTFPFLLLCLFVTKCYNSFDTFIRFAPLAVIPVGALLFHFIAYRQKFRIGPSFFGICAVALSVTLGGTLIISPAEYFSGTSLFYIFGLGIGMAGTYLLLKSAFTEKEDYNIRTRLLAQFYLAGLFGCFMILSHYAIHLSEIITLLVEENRIIEIQWSNNLSTMLMLFMPAPFYFAVTRHGAHILPGLLFYVAIVLTGSRSGLIMGALELILCLIYAFVCHKGLRIPILSLCTLVGIFLVIFIAKLPSIIDMETFQYITENEVRFKLMERAIEDFKANPLFGRGIGYTGNSDHYSPVKGAANWYHMIVFQVIGSLGLVGVVAYLFQFVGRLVLIFKNTDVTKLALGLCYGGMLLMSMLNPGEFCPVPYEMLTVLLFILLELPAQEKENDNAFLPSGLPRPTLRRKNNAALQVDWYE